jgi:F0F1-type ATP synthase delta subunit
MELLKLPAIVISQSDISRLLRELNGLDDFFVGANARVAGTKMQLPKISRQMDQLARDNHINLLDDKVRQNLSAALKVIEDKAPKMHISFAVEASPKALEKILVWLRQNVDPQVLLQVGLQPSIAAGCMLRTTNKIFDMSLRSNLKKQTPYLTQLIQGAVDGR